MFAHAHASGDLGLSVVGSQQQTNVHLPARKRELLQLGDQLDRQRHLMLDCDADQS